VFSDEEWLDNYIKTNAERLKNAYDGLKEALAVVGATLYESEGAVMTWADFRSCLPPNPTWEDEEKLCKRLFEECGFLITPGHTCYNDIPGFYRIVYTESGEGAMEELKDRLSKFKV